MGLGGAQFGLQGEDLLDEGDQSVAEGGEDGAGWDLEGLPVGVGVRPHVPLVNPFTALRRCSGGVFPGVPCGGAASDGSRGRSEGRGAGVAGVPVEGEHECQRVWVLCCSGPGWKEVVGGLDVPVGMPAESHSCFLLFSELVVMVSQVKHVQFRGGGAVIG